MRNYYWVIVLFCMCLAPVSVAQTIDEDAMLLEIIAQQSRDLQSRDTMFVGDSAIVLCDTMWKRYSHPLCIRLMYVPESFPSLLDTVSKTVMSVDKIRSEARRFLIQNHADLFVSVSDSNRLKAVEVGKLKVQRAKVKDVNNERLEAARALREVKSHWRKEANIALQMTQNYATENWQQGAVNSFSLLWSAKAFANYKKGNISWNNTAEWRLGVSTVSGDTLRKMNTTDDVFQLYSKFGYQVHKKWYVTFSADFRTNLFPSYRTNSMEFITTFLTPIRYSMGVGIDYKPIKGFSINVLPVTYKLVYANHSDPQRVNVTDYGIEAGCDILNEVGSSLRLEWLWKPLHEIELTTKFYFFTNYQQIETELVIDANFIINRYLSAKIMLHPRYDGTVERVSGEKVKLQFKELISVGFAHKFK